MNAKVFPIALEFQVESYLDGVRVDTFLGKQLRNYSTQRLARMVTAGAASIHHQPIPIDRRVFCGEVVRIQLLEPPDKLLEAQPIPLNVVFEDPWLIVLNKPPGIIAHPTGDYQSGTLSNGVQYYLDQKTKARGLLRPGIVHRLDRQTSGLIVLAKEHLAHRELSLSFQESRVCKMYTAIVHGRVRANSGLIELPIGRARKDSLVLMSTRAHALGRKPAKTQYRVIERFPRHTLVAAVPLSGRNHQIRVHLASIGHPLWGDPFYAANNTFKHPGWSGESEYRLIRPICEYDRHALHANRLAFGHPITGAWMEFKSSLPADLLVLLKQLRANQTEPVDGFRT